FPGRWHEMRLPAPRIPVRRKINYRLLLETIRGYREEAAGAETLDRRVVLTRLMGQFGVDEEELALRGFDRAYRLIVEGV
ncbi:MAG: hypothetical protein O7D96_01920, partial [SAR324 cluster bacterium]|nr:hypothetical protein [SAR324 cluster bacterium]